MFEEIKKICNDPIRLIEYKRKLLYPLIKDITNQLVTIDDSVIDNTIIKNKICYLSENDCSKPCKFTDDICKLIVHSKSFDDKNLINKFIWKLIDLLLYNNADINKINNYKIEPYELRKTINIDEIFFTFQDFQDDYINTLFNIENSFIRNI